MTGRPDVANAIRVVLARTALQAKGRGATVAMLANETGKARNTICNALLRMERNGEVERYRYRSDRERSHNIFPVGPMWYRLRQREPA